MANRFDPEQSWSHLRFMSETVRLLLKNAYEQNIPITRMYVLLELEYLIQQGVDPSIADLMAATGLPKSTVRRAVADMLGGGLLSEQINSQNRRFRVFDYSSERGRDIFTKTALEQIEKYLGPDGETVLRGLLNARLESDPQLRASLDWCTLSERRRKRESGDLS